LRTKARAQAVGIEGRNLLPPFPNISKMTYVFAKRPIKETYERELVANRSLEAST